MQDAVLIAWCLTSSQLNVYDGRLRNCYGGRWDLKFLVFLCFSYYAREFIEKIPEKRLTSQKMDCIHNMVKTKLFEDQGRHPRLRLC